MRTDGLRCLPITWLMREWLQLGSLVLQLVSMLVEEAAGLYDQRSNLASRIQHSKAMLYGWHRSLQESLGKVLAAEIAAAIHLSSAGMALSHSHLYVSA